MLGTPTRGLIILVFISIRDGDRVDYQERSTDAVFKDLNPPCQSSKRLLVRTLNGRVLLVQDDGDRGRLAANVPLAKDDAETHSHPANCRERFVCADRRERLSAISPASS